MKNSKKKVVNEQKNDVRETKYLKEIILTIIVLVLVTFFFSSTFLNLVNFLLNFLFPFV
jgi:hypothetical protein